MSERKWTSMKGKDCVYVWVCVRVREETVVSLALQCLQTGNVCPRQKGRNLAAPHGKHCESSLTRAHTGGDVEKTHTHLQQCKKEESDESKVGYLVLGKWECLGWALTVLHFPPCPLPTQTPADRKSIRWPHLNWWAQECPVTGLSTVIHTNRAHIFTISSSFTSYFFCCHSYLMN